MPDHRADLLVCCPLAQIPDAPLHGHGEGRHAISSARMDDIGTYYSEVGRVIIKVVVHGASPCCSLLVHDHHLQAPTRGR